MDNDFCKNTLSHQRKAAQALNEQQPYSAARPQEDVVKILYDLDTNQIDFEFQDQNQNSSQVGLVKSWNRCVDLYDEAPVGYCTLSKKGLFLEVNLTAANMLGLTRSELIGQSIYRFIHQGSHDIYDLLRDLLLASSNPHSFELQMVKYDGTPFRAHMLAIVVQGTSGNLVRHIVLSDMSTHTQIEQALLTSLTEKELLLREVHHRVKNNLAAIMGLVDMQGRTAEREKEKDAMTELGARIKSMALLHEQLYKSDDLSRINMQEYIEALVGHLFLSYERTGDIHISVTAPDIVMDLDEAAPCGQLITELAINSFKYAFPEATPTTEDSNCEIRVSAGWDGTAYTLVVADNGVGLPVDLDWTAHKTSGLQLVRMIAEHQLRGKIDLDRSNGTTFRLRFGSTASKKR